MLVILTILERYDIVCLTFGYKRTIFFFVSAIVWNRKTAGLDPHKSWSIHYRSHCKRRDKNEPICYWLFVALSRHTHVECMFLVCDLESYISHNTYCPLLLLSSTRSPLFGQGWLTISHLVDHRAECLSVLATDCEKHKNKKNAS